jgi:hypothetical protein
MRISQSTGIANSRPHCSTKRVSDMKRYKYATVHVDQASRLSFVWLQKSATADETLEGKTAFEQYAKE